MASNLTKDKPEISSPGSKKSKSESSSVDTPLSAQSCPISEETLIAGKDSPLTLAKLFKEEEPFYRDLVDDISKDPAYIRWERLLKRHYRAIARNNPPKFDVEGCSSAVKQFLDNPQLVAKVKLFWDGVEKLIPSIPIETNPDAYFSLSYDIPLEESKNGGPPTFKRNFTDIDTLQKDMVEDCRLTYESIASLPKVRRKQFKYEMVTGVKINAKDESGRTALHSACAKGKLKKAKFLIKNGIDIGITDIKGNTALHYAAAHGNERCVKLMLESGADAAHTNSYGDTAYGIAELNDETGVMDLIKKLVEKDG